MNIKNNLQSKHMQKLEHLRQKLPKIIVKHTENDKRIYTIKDTTVKTLFVIIFLFIIFTFFFGLKIVTGTEMSPALQDGDLVLYSRMSKTFSSGDLAVFKKNGETQIKRVVAIPGDEVNMTEDGTLEINGSSTTEEMTEKTYKTGTKLSFPHAVPPEKYFVLGDARENTIDSRNYGDVSKDEIKGKVICILIRIHNL